jgi:hypothetical protein
MRGVAPLHTAPPPGAANDHELSGGAGFGGYERIGSRGSWKRDQARSPQGFSSSIVSSR